MFALLSKIRLHTQTGDWKYSGSRGDRSSANAFPGQKQGQYKHCFVRANIAQPCPGGERCYLATSKSVWNLLETLRSLGTLPTVLLDAKNTLAVISQAKGSAGLSPSLTFIWASTTCAVIQRTRTRNQTRLKLTQKKKKLDLNMDLHFPDGVCRLAHNSCTGKCADTPEGSCWECVCGDSSEI